MEDKCGAAEEGAAAQPSKEEEEVDNALLEADFINTGAVASVRRRLERSDSWHGRKRSEAQVDQGLFSAATEDEPELLEEIHDHRLSSTRHLTAAGSGGRLSGAAVAARRSSGRCSAGGSEVAHFKRLTNGRNTEIGVRSSFCDDTRDPCDEAVLSNTHSSIMADVGGFSYRTPTRAIAKCEGQMMLAVPPLRLERPEEVMMEIASSSSRAVPGILRKPGSEMTSTGLTGKRKSTRNHSAATYASNATTASSCASSGSQSHINSSPKHTFGTSEASVEIVRFSSEAEARDNAYDSGGSPPAWDSGTTTETGTSSFYTLETLDFCMFEDEDLITRTSLAMAGEMCDGYLQASESSAAAAATTSAAAAKVHVPRVPTSPKPSRPAFPRRLSESSNSPKLQQSNNNGFP